MQPFELVRRIEQLEKRCNALELKVAELERKKLLTLPVKMKPSGQ